MPSRIVADMGAGDDNVWLYGLDLPIEVHAGPGNDKVRGSDGNDRIYGGDDLLLGDEEKSGLSISGNDTLSGGAGNDQIFGIGGDDALDGGPGADEMIADELCIYTANTPNCQWSVPGNDTISAQDGEKDEIECGGGTDSAVVDPIDTVTDVFAVFHNQCEQIDGPVRADDNRSADPRHNSADRRATQPAGDTVEGLHHCPPPSAGRPAPA